MHLETSNHTTTNKNGYSTGWNVTHYPDGSTTLLPDGSTTLLWVCHCELLTLPLVTSHLYLDPAAFLWDSFLAFFSLMGDLILLSFAPYLPWISFQYAPPSQKDGIELETRAPTHTLKSFIDHVSLPPLTLSLACQLPLLAFQLPLTWGG